MYALAITPLIRELHNRHPEIDQVWYADDASCAGTCRNLKKWWDYIRTTGPKYGYFPKNSKSHLVVKPEFEENAKSIFEGTDIHITTGGTRHLGAVIGSGESKDEFVVNKVKTWVKRYAMADFASTQPHAVYAALVHGGLSRWSFIFRTIPDIQDLMQPLEDTIHQQLIPAITGRPPCSNIEREIFALPSRLGGLGITKPTNSQPSFHASVTQPLVKLINAQSLDGLVSPDHLIDARKSIRNTNRLRGICAANDLENSLTNDQKRQIALAKEKGASSWLSVMPIEEHGFFLNKGEFRDALHLCYGWEIRNAPQSCVCGSSFAIDHAMTCKRGGFANLLSQVCHNVATEPPLQPLSGETFRYKSAIVGAEARLDVKARGFWNRTQDAFFDVRVFHPNAPCYRSKDIASVFKQHEAAKKREYNQRVQNIEHGVFTPLVFSTTGSMGKEGITFYKRLADMLARKQEKSYSVVMGWLRCRLSFAIQRSAIMCIRGTRSAFGNAINEQNLTLAAAEGQTPPE